MTPTPRVMGSAAVGVLGLLLAVVTRRPEPAVLSAPFLTVALVGLVALRPPHLAAAVTVEPRRLVEGDQLELVVQLDSSGPGRVRVALDLPPGAELVDDGGEHDAATELLVGAGPDSVSWTLVATRWGATGRVTAAITASDLLGAWVRRAVLQGPVVKVLPSEDRLRSLVGPRTLRSISGAHLSRQRGDGIEFVDSREFAPGDRARDVNWRVSARRGELWVDERRPERSGEVVLFLDSFVSVGDSPDNSLRRAVEVARALASCHLGANDRVGLVDLGGVLRWVRPSGGTVQLYRIAETLVETEAWASGADKTVDVLPPRALPRRCLVVAVSPLVDARGVEALRTLRARGFDVAVVEVPATAFVPPAGAARTRLAQRLWQAELAAVRRQLRHDGIAVGVWRPDQPLDPVLDSIGLFRTAVLRSAR